MSRVFSNPLSTILSRIIVDEYTTRTAIEGSEMDGVVFEFDAPINYDTEVGYRSKELLIARTAGTDEDHTLYVVAQRERSDIAQIIEDGEEMDSGDYEDEDNISDYKIEVSPWRGFLVKQEQVAGLVFNFFAKNVGKLNGFSDAFDLSRIVSREEVNQACSGLELAQDEKSSFIFVYNPEIGMPGEESYHSLISSAIQHAFENHVGRNQLGTQFSEGKKDEEVNVLDISFDVMDDNGKEEIKDLRIFAPYNYVGVYTRTRSVQAPKPRFSLQRLLGREPETEAEWECISYHDSGWRSDGVESFIYENASHITGLREAGQGWYTSTSIGKAEADELKKLTSLDSRRQQQERKYNAKTAI